MPAVRLSRRRRSSLAISAFGPIKAGTYGFNSPSPRVVTFAPNVTPGTYVEPELSSPEEPESAGSDGNAKLFPPSQSPAPAPSRRRVPPGKRRSMGYIPRPPNAFMLFRADFVRQKHVPGSIETNHGSLSKIIGNCWRSLPLEEKKVWEIKAKHAKAEHKRDYPEYRFRPVHNKNKEKKEKTVTTPDDERRCEEVAQLLLEGKKGDELAAAVRTLDNLRETVTPPANLYSNTSEIPYHLGHRRSSSVPLPDYRYNGMALPALPFFPPTGQTGSVYQHDSRMMYGQRRPSSVPPVSSRSWMMYPVAEPTTLARDTSPLPEVDASLFSNFSFDGSSNFSFNQPAQQDAPFNFGDFFNNLPPDATTPSDPGMSPLDPIAPHDMMNQRNITSFSQMYHHPQLDPATWLPMDQHSLSDPSSSYSGSPAPSEASLPVTLHAPKPQIGVASPPFELWNAPIPFQVAQAHQQQHHHMQNQHQAQQQQVQQPQETYHQPEYVNYDHHTGEMGIGVDYSQMHHQPQSCGPEMQGYAQNLETLFEPTYAGADMNGHVQSLDYQYDTMIQQY